MCLGHGKIWNIAKMLKSKQQYTQQDRQCNMAGQYGDKRQIVI